MSVAFNDPDAWGYCRYCAFNVARDLLTGDLFVHERMDPGWIKRRCYGSLLSPTPQPGPEAVAVSPEEVTADADGAE